MNHPTSVQRILAAMSMVAEDANGGPVSSLTQFENPEVVFAAGLRRAHRRHKRLVNETNGGFIFYPPLIPMFACAPDSQRARRRREQLGRT